MAQAVDGILSVFRRWWSGPSVVFLVGSGASRAAGVPGVAQISATIRSGKILHEHTDGRFYLLPTPLASLSGASLEVRRTIFLYRLLAALARADPRREPNYEEVYFVARQLLDHELREFENPALRGLIEDLRRRLAVSGLGVDELGDPVELRDALTNLCNYIHDATWRALQGQFSHAHLQPFAIAVRRLGRKCRAIVTLNHDELVREALEGARVPFEDGFDPESTGLSRWRPSRFGNTGLRLIHLHGSLRWFWTARDGIPEDALVLRRIATSDIDHVHLASGELLLLADNRPYISLGTHNKVTSYFRQPFSELYAQLTMFLREDSTVRTLVMAGYGGQDKGVNLQISDWMQQRHDRRIVLVHPDPPGFVRDARPHLRSQWADWEARGRICTISKRFEEVTAEELITSVSSYLF